MDIEKEELEEKETKERKKAKNQRKNYTIIEILIVLNNFKETKSVSDTAKFFDLPLISVSGWVQRQEDYFSTD